MSLSSASRGSDFGGSCSLRKLTNTEVALRRHPAKAEPHLGDPDQHTKRSDVSV